MKILISNDDGINCGGIQLLAQTLAKRHEVYVVAPDRQRSASSLSLTLNTPIKVEKLEESNNIKFWTTTGTPVDCVKIALSTILKDNKPDIVISGINNGPNLGYDIQYSGTVGAAIEAYMLGFKAVAISLVTLDAKYEDFKFAAKFMDLSIDKLLNSDVRLLNINVPNVNESEIQGIEITKLGRRIFTSEYNKTIGENGEEMYTLAGVPAHDPQTEITDIAAIREKKISITPLNFDMTNYDKISLLQNVDFSVVGV